MDPFFCVLPFCIYRVWKKERGKRIQNKSFVSLSIVVPGSSIWAGTKPAREGKCSKDGHNRHQPGSWCSSKVIDTAPPNHTVTLKCPFQPWFYPWLKTSQFVFGSKGSHKCWKILVISDIFLVNLLWVVSTVILKSVAEGLRHKYLTIGWAGDESPHSKNITICARESFWRLCNVRLVDLVNWQQGKLSEVRILYLGNAFRAKGSSSASVMFQYIAILAMMVTRKGKVCAQHKWQLGN